MVLPVTQLAELFRTAIAIFLESLFLIYRATSNILRIYSPYHDPLLFLKRLYVFYPCFNQYPELPRAYYPSWVPPMAKVLLSTLRCEPKDLSIFPKLFIVPVGYLNPRRYHQFYWGTGGIRLDGTDLFHQQSFPFVKLLFFPSSDPFALSGDFFPSFLFLEVPVFVRYSCPVASIGPAPFKRTINPLAIAPGHGRVPMTTVRVSLKRGMPSSEVPFSPSSSL